MWFRWLCVLILLTGCSTVKPMPTETEEGSRIYHIAPKNVHNVNNFYEAGILKSIMDATPEQWDRIKEFFGLVSEHGVHQTGGFYDVDLEAAITRKQEEAITSSADAKFDANVSGLPK